LLVETDYTQTRTTEYMISRTSVWRLIISLLCAMNEQAERHQCPDTDNLMQSPPVLY